VLLAVSFTPALAGTTGGLRGRVVDRDTQHGIAGFIVTIASPSQTASVKTDAQGNFVFISLIPDTYALTISEPGYITTTLQGITVVADQVPQITVPLEKTKTIGRVSTTSSSVVKAGLTSDLYSINAAGAEAAMTLGGAGGLNQAYSAMASVPGVSLQQGQQGWNQLVYVRGGDYEDTAVELDGVPVMRASDGAPISTLTNLGQGELQIYTGGAPASADASGLSGYVNQVIRTGNYPGFREITIGDGGPAGYHKEQIELGGATENRNFTYYVGYSLVDQQYRYGTQFNNSSDPLYFYPLAVSTGAAGVCATTNCFTAAPGQSYSIATDTDSEFVGNFHFAIPHKDGTGKDDVQLLYTNGRVLAPFYGSVDDLGGESYVQNAIGYPVTYVDNYQYTGALMQPLNPNNIVEGPFPNSPPGHAFATTLVPPEQRETTDNNFALLKLQYQRNFDDHSFLRLFAYTDYNNWFINGPVSSNLDYGGEIADYEVNGHTYGLNARYDNQITSKHLITATASYQVQRTKTVSNGSNGGEIEENLVGPGDQCFSQAGFYAPCYGNSFVVTQYGTTPVFPAAPPAGSPAALAGAQWLVTENGQNAQVDNVRPYFSAVSLSDQWQINDKFVFNGGLRYEEFVYGLNNTNLGPGRDFWFTAYNDDYCYTPSTGITQTTINPLTGANSGCPSGSTPLVNSSPSSVSYGALQPRTGFTYKFNPDTVIRGSYGRYAQQPGASYQQYNYLQQNSPAELSAFLPYGFDSPYHETQPSYSNSYDLSLEKRIKGTDLGFKVTPFFRVTQDEEQSIPIGAQGVVDGINTGTGHADGIEFEFTKSDFSHEGFSFQLGYTFTHSVTTFGNFPGTNVNFIDDLNNEYIKPYNALTSFCATHPKNSQCGSTPSGVAAAPCYTPANAQTGAPGTPVTGVTTTAACPVGDIINPYWNAQVQPLLDPTGSYTPYDILPSNPYDGEVGFVTPEVVSAVVNYRAHRLTLTPTASYTSGTYYGAPASWPGYDPSTCTQAATGAAQPVTSSCTTAISIPDVYTGKFDEQGAFREPTRFTLNFQAGYELSRNVKITLSLTNIIDHCYQRGYAWDNPTTCVYAQLPSNLLAPVGNFVTPLASAPAQLRYPYGSFYNNVQTGFSGQQQPFGAFLNLQMRL
jgi:hypothetical protein